MSVLGKRWLVKNQEVDLPTLEKVLKNRAFDEATETKNLHDPFLFNDMQKAVTRIEEAIKAGEKIVVFGDYDVDGISGTAIVVSILKHLNANVVYMLPSRMKDGYGLSLKFIDRFVEEKINLAITVDCGISCAKEVAKAKENNIDVIITDHHAIPHQFPNDAYTVIHPKLPNSKYPYKELTGSAVAFKLAHALIKNNIPKKDQEELLEKFVDLASLGIVADLGPLTGENRFIVKEGLRQLKNTKWQGLKKIIEAAGIEDRVLDAYDIGFKIAPRINAAGRIGDATLALKLILGESENMDFAGQSLENLNKERQEMTFGAFAKLEEYFSELETLPYIFIAESPEYHVGVLGLVSARLVEKFGRPAIIMQDNGDVLTGSARSTDYFNITEALGEFKDLLISFGGHFQAAGFNIKKENLEEFKKGISHYAEEKLKDTDLNPILEIDCEIPQKEISLEFIRTMEKLKPFGVGNKRPVFMLNNIEPQFISTAGKNNDHLKFSVNINGRNINAIGFGLASHAQTLRSHRKIDVVFHLEKNIWNHREFANIQMVDFKGSGQG
jgi:single-stranded-DNA-specific exonuclease